MFELKEDRIVRSVKEDALSYYLFFLQVLRGFTEDSSLDPCSMFECGMYCTFIFTRLLLSRSLKLLAWLFYKNIDAQNGYFGLEVK